MQIAGYKSIYVWNQTIGVHFQKMLDWLGIFFGFLPMIKTKLLLFGNGNVIQALAPDVDKRNKIKDIFISHVAS